MPTHISKNVKRKKEKKEKNENQKVKKKIDNQLTLTNSKFFMSSPITFRRILIVIFLEIPRFLENFVIISVFLKNERLKIGKIFKMVKTFF